MIHSAVVTTEKRGGRPRKRAEDEDVIKPSIRMTPEQAARLSALALAEGLSINDLVIQLVEQAAASHPDRELIQRRVNRVLRGELPRKPKRD